MVSLLSWQDILRDELPLPLSVFLFPHPNESTPKCPAQPVLLFRRPFSSPSLLPPVVFSSLSQSAGRRFVSLGSGSLFLVSAS